MTSLKKWLALALSVVVILGLTAGCGGSASSTPASTPATSGSQPAASSTPAPAEQVLKYATDTWPAGFDPHTISAAAAIRVFGQVYECLIDFNEDMSFRPVLAEKWETPDDRTYVFTLRKGVKFHNGREMTAEDVKYSFERILGRGAAGELAGALGNSPSYYKGIETIEVVDPYTVKFVLAAPNAAFLSGLTSRYGAIVPKEIAEANANSLMTIDTMCGTGPFMYKSSTIDNNIVLVKNEDYYVADQPKLDGVSFYLIADEGARLAALQTGEVNLTPLSAMNLPTAQSNPDLKVLEYQSLYYTFLGFNLSNKELQNKDVRHAMSMAVNRDEIINYVYSGQATVSSFAPPAMGRWTWNPTQSALYKQDLAAAKALMEKAGYSETNRLKMTMAAGLLDSIRDTAVILQQQLKPIYIDVEITNLESAQYVEIWGKMNTPEAGFDSMCGYNGSGTDPNRAVSFFYSTTGGANKWGYTNAKVDELCAKGVATTDDATRKAAYDEAQQIIIDESPNLWFCSPMEYFFVRSNVNGYEPFAADIHNLRNCTIS